MSSWPPEAFSRAELLDGDVVTVRRLIPSDGDDLLQLYEPLADDECYLRFFTSHPAHLQAWAKPLTENSDEHYALGAFAGRQAARRGQLFRVHNPGDAEVAVVVAHGEHLRGVGTVLLRKLGRVAKAHGIRRFIAEVLTETENHAMLRVLADAGWHCVWERDSSVSHVDVDLDEIGDPK
jgi:GNAT superfamily N-acetyltransferase